MANKKMLLNDLKAIRKNKIKQEIKQACIEALFPQKATIKECRLVIEDRFGIKLSNNEFSKWKKEYEAKMQTNPLMHVIFSVPKKTKKTMRN